jgi:aldehyde:ferredoxin oxidoreductase
MTVCGYAGKILIVDLTTGKTRTEPTSSYAPLFLGGRGIAAKLFWDLAPPRAKALEPDNCIICATGPITGFNGVAGGRWTICAKSAAGEPEAFTHGNLGGRWGATLKMSGFDALAVTGKADQAAYLFIHHGQIEIRSAAGLWGQTTFETQAELSRELGSHAFILTIGPAAENLVSCSTAMAEKGASVSAGLGSVFGSKNLKAIVVVGDNRPQAAFPDRLKAIADYIRPIRAGTFDAPSPWAIEGLTRPDICYNCGLGCTRQSYNGENQRRYKSFCQAGVFYARAARDYYQGWNAAQLRATQLCDDYGLDTLAMQALIGFLQECYREKVITEAESGLPLSKIGSLEFIDTLIKQLAFRTGLGALLAEGTLKAAAKMGNLAQQIASHHVVTRANESGDYDPRLLMNTALLYATELRRPIQQLHAVAGNLIVSWSRWAQGQPGAFFTTADLREVARRFWGSVQAADYSSWEGKALCSKTVQDRAYAQESLVLCDIHWPMMITSVDHPAGHVGDPTLESRILSAVTGEEVDSAGLLEIGERIFNLQRAILIRQGWRGRQDDCLADYYHNEPLKTNQVFFNPQGIMPGPRETNISKIGCRVEKTDFENLKSEYYHLRGWNVETGFPTRSHLNHLKLGEISEGLQAAGLFSENISE